MLHFDKYEVVEKIGEGGFGIVYEGFDPQIRRRVAIKTCTAEDDTSRQRFFREAEYAGNLHHRNITVVFDVGEQDGLPYMVQEYLGGEDLDRKILRRDDLSFSTKLLYLIQIASGLEHAHSRGVVHRDIKPSNIRVLDDGLVKIMDFGIARSQDGPTLTVAGQAVGTAAYLSPEQIRGQPADIRCDIHAFGVLAYELMTYRRAYPGKKALAVMQDVLESEPEPLAALWPEAPPGLVALLEKCYRKRPANRYRHFGEVLAELDALNTGGKRGRDASETTRPPGQELGSGTVPAESPPPGHPGEPALTTGKTQFTGNALARPDVDEVPLQGRTSSPVGPSESQRAAVAARSPSPARYLWLLLVTASLGATGAYWFTRPAPLPAAPEAVTTSPGRDLVPARSRSESLPVGESSEEGQRSTRSGTPQPVAETIEATSARLVIEPGWNKSITVSVSNQPAIALDRSRTFRLRANVDHFLEFSLLTPEYEASANHQVRLGHGEERRISPPIPRPGGLTVRAALRAPQVFVRIGGRALGTTPIQRRLLTPGEYTITVARDPSSQDPPAATQRVSIRSDRLLVLTFDTREGAEPIVVERDLERDG